MHKATFVLLMLTVWRLFTVVDTLLCQSHSSCEASLFEKCIRTEVKTEQLEKRAEDLEATQTADRAVLIDEIRKCSEKIMDLKKDMSEIDIIKSRQGPVIAFSAFNPSTLSLGDGPIIVYQETLLNEGSGYDSSTGVFTAPTAGLYLFTAHTCSFATKYAIVAIVHKNTKISIDTQYAQESSCGSVSALLHVAAGETVHVASAYRDTQMKIDPYRRNSFLGALLHMS